MNKFLSISNIKAIWSKRNSTEKDNDVDYEIIINEDAKQKAWEELVIRRRKREAAIPSDKGLITTSNGESQSGLLHDNASTTSSATTLEDTVYSLGIEIYQLKKRITELEIQLKYSMDNPKVVRSSIQVSPIKQNFWEELVRLGKKREVARNSDWQSDLHNNPSASTTSSVTALEVGEHGKYNMVDYSIPYNINTSTTTMPIVDLDTDKNCSTAKSNNQVNIIVSDKSTLNIIQCEPLNTNKKSENIDDVGVDSNRSTSPDHVMLAQQSISESTHNQDKQYDDLPDLKHIPGEVILNSLLKGSMDTIATLDSYIRQHHVKVEDFHADYISTENYYRLDNKVYYLNFEQWEIVSDIVSECRNLDTITKTVSKNPIMTKGLAKSIEKGVISLQQAKYDTIYHKVIKSLDIPIVCKIISKSLNYILIKHYSIKNSEKPKELLVSYSTISKSIGDLIAKFYIEKFILQTGDQLIKETVKRKTALVYVHNKVDQETLLAFVGKIKAKTITMGDYASTFKFSLTNKELFEYINASLYLNELEDNSILPNKDEEINFTKAGLESLKTKFVINIGAIVVEELINQAVLNKGQDSWKVPIISFKKDMEIDLYASATFYKPSLLKTNIDISYKHKLDTKISVTLDVDRRKVKHSSNTHLIPTPKLKELLNDNPEMTIASNEYKEFLQYILEILNKDFSIKDEDILNFLWIYNLNFREIIKNIQDDALMDNLMRYALDFDIYHSNVIKQQCENNSSALAIYYKISAYKYYVKGLFNDCNIFSKFNYFYVDKFITSSGRRFSKTIFLTQQGFKLSKVFCIFKSVYNTSINENNFKIINKVIASKLTTTSLIKEVEDFTYAKYLKDTDSLYIAYINSFLKPNVNYKDYPLKFSYIDQIAWLYSNIKKSNEVFIVKVIINNYFNKSNLGIVYELDATSSGIQLVSLLIKSRALGKISNVVGKGYTDIYKSYAHDFNDMMNTAKTFITGILKELTMPHLTKLINEERITDISKADTLGKSIRYFLYCNETELPVVAKNLSISIGKLILTKRWKPINLKIPNNLYWMFNTFHKEFYTKLAKDNISYILRLLLYARVTFEYFACLADNPWIDLTNRNLYKKPIMSYAYNMGRTGRIAHYIEYFNDNANERGFTSVNQHSIESLSRIIDNYFLVFDAKYLRDGRDFLNIIKGYITHSCNVKQPIGITNQYVSWEFKPYKTTVDRVWLFKKHKLSIYTNTDEIDEDKAVTSFSSIFVHSIDAHIVFLFESMISEIKHELANKGIKLSISTFTNHDNFGIILAFAIYLKIILKDNYNSISNFEYLKQLGNPITNEILVQVLTKVNLICENDNFIKH